jgi:hypothetical protein
MMVRKFLLTAAAASMAAAPVVAQAAPARTPAPVAGGTENIRRGLLIPIGVFILLVGGLILLFDDDKNGPQSP